MKKIFKIFLLFSLIGKMALLADEVLATVNGETIFEEDVNNFVKKSIPGATYNSLTDTQKKTVVNQMVDRRLFLEDAKQSNIENNTEYKEALKKLRENLLLDYWMKEKVEEISISEDEAKKYYVNHLENFSKPASVKVRHILLPTEDEAITLIAELLESVQLKQKFIELAHSESVGPSSVNGGALNWFVSEQMVPEFSEAAFALKIGTITNKAIKTQFGYHIIYLEDKHDEGAISYELVKEDIVTSLRLIRFKEKLKKLSKKLKKNAKILIK